MLCKCIDMHYHKHYSLCIDHYQRLHSLDFTINLSLVHDSLLDKENGKVTKSMRCKYLTLSEYNRKRGMKSRVSKKAGVVQRCSGARLKRNCISFNTRVTFLQNSYVP